MTLWTAALQASLFLTTSWSLSPRDTPEIDFLLEEATRMAPVSNLEQTETTKGFAQENGQEGKRRDRQRCVRCFVLRTEKEPGA